MQFGRRRARGIVAALEESPPEGIEASAVEGVVGTVSPALVDLALWLADYYGPPLCPPDYSGPTPARALGLVAPAFPRRRRPRPPPAERQSLAGEHEPAE